jgi:hypothetical protein
VSLASHQAVSQTKLKAFNMSFGECEFYPYLDGAILVDEVFAEAALRGVTPFVSADDQGPPDTAYPASSPYVIAVGGTNLFTNSYYTYDFGTGCGASGRRHQLLRNGAGPAKLHGRWKYAVGARRRGWRAERTGCVDVRRWKRTGYLRREHHCGWRRHPGRI